METPSAGSGATFGMPATDDEQKDRISPEASEEPFHLFFSLNVFCFI